MPKLSDLQALTDLNRVDFLRTDLGVCFTFVDLAKTEREIGDLAAAHRALQNAERGYTVVLRISADVKNIEQKYEIEQKLTELRARLDSEQNRLNAPSA